MANVFEYNDMMYTNFDPKMQNHFIMEIDGIPSYMVKVAARPGMTFDEVVLDHINLKRKLKGKGSWEDIQLTLYDPIVPSGMQAVMEWVRLSHEALTGRDGYTAMYKKDIDLYLMGPVGDKVEQWKIKGAWIKSFAGGALDWSQGALVELTVTLAFDNAILEY